MRPSIPVVTGLLALGLVAIGALPVGAQQFTCGRDDQDIANRANAARQSIGGGPEQAYKTLDFAANYFYNCAKNERGYRGETPTYWSYYQTTAMTQMSAGDAAQAQSDREKQSIYDHNTQAWATTAANQRVNAFRGFEAICRAAVPSAEMKRRALSNMQRLRTQMPGWQNAAILSCQ